MRIMSDESNELTDYLGDMPDELEELPPDLETALEKPEELPPDLEEMPEFEFVRKQKSRAFIFETVPKIQESRKCGPQKAFSVNFY